MTWALHLSTQSIAINGTVVAIWVALWYPADATSLERRSTPVRVDLWHLVDNDWFWGHSFDDDLANGAVVERGSTLRFGFSLVSSQPRLIGSPGDNDKGKNSGAVFGCEQVDENWRAFGDVLQGSTRSRTKLCVGLRTAP